LLAVLERLSPEERAAFLLHEAFESDYADIARTLGKSEAGCRQLVSRARRRVRAERPRVQVSAAATARLLDGFVAALKSQDKDAMLLLLADEACWTSDGGGKALAARKPITGRERVARFATGAFRKVADDLELRRVHVNGEPGLAAFVRGSLLSVIAISTDGRSIIDVFSIMNPEKLRAVEISPR
jgi:RNA polymerase sigma-70 factor (ECF subfamily)